MIDNEIEDTYDAIPEQIIKIERKYPPHKKTKVNKRRKCSIGHEDLGERVDSVVRIQRRLEQSLKCR